MSREDMLDGVAPLMGAAQSPKMTACPELLRSCNGASVAGEKQGRQGWWEMPSGGDSRPDS